MKSTRALIGATLVATAVAVSPTAHAEPTTLDGLCAAQSWPRPVPDVVGLRYDPIAEEIPAGANGGALACWTDVHAVTPDGRDARVAATVGWDTIASVWPPAGTLVDRDETLTLHLTPMQWDAPTDFRPCDWVPAADVAAMFDFTGPVETDGYVPPGSVEPGCTYRDPGRTAVRLTLFTAGAFPVDAASSYALHPNGSGTPVTGLGQAARCVTGLHGAQGSPYNEVVVLLADNRLLQTQGLGAQPCEQLQRFAQAAIAGL
jgi:hypothetical protein